MHTGTHGAIEASCVANIQPAYEPPALTWAAVVALVERGKLLQWSWRALRLIYVCHHEG